MVADVEIALRAWTSSNVHRLYNATVRDLSCVRFDIFQQLSTKLALTQLGDRAVLHTLTAHRAKLRSRRLFLGATHVTEHLLAGSIASAGFVFSSGSLHCFGQGIDVHVVHSNRSCPTVPSWVACLEPHEAKYHCHRNRAPNANRGQCHRARRRTRRRWRPWGWSA